jgi:hypothetical protein
MTNEQALEDQRHYAEQSAETVKQLETAAAALRAARAAVNELPDTAGGYYDHRLGELAEETEKHGQDLTAMKLNIEARLARFEAGDFSDL